MPLPDRSEDVLEIASSLICDEATLSDQVIDCYFIFRFEHGWQLRIRKIRTCLNQLAGISDSSDLLPSESFPKMWAYLEITKNLMDIPNNITLRDGFNNHKPFRPYNSKLSKRYDVLISDVSGNMNSIEDIWPAIEEEKKFVDTIQNSILLAAQQYQIVPLGFDLWKQFAFEEIELALVNLRNFLLFGHPIPKYIWPEIIYFETKMDKGIRRWLRPDSAGSRAARLRNSSQIRSITRVRTWSVYFLSKRGGGSKYEHEAVDIWNDRFMDNLAPRNYRAERTKLLQGISRV